MVYSVGGAGVGGGIAFAQLTMTSSSGLSTTGRVRLLMRSTVGSTPYTAAMAQRFGPAAHVDNAPVLARLGARDRHDNRPVRRPLPPQCFPLQRDGARRRSPGDEHIQDSAPLCATPTPARCADEVSVA